MIAAQKRNGMALLIVLVVLAILSSVLVMTANHAVFAKRAMIQQWRKAQVELVFLASLERTTHLLSQDSLFKGESWQVELPEENANQFLVTSVVSEKTDHQIVVTLSIEAVNHQAGLHERSYVLNKANE